MVNTTDTMTDTQVFAQSDEISDTSPVSPEIHIIRQDFFAKWVESEMVIIPDSVPIEQWTRASRVTYLYNDFLERHHTMGKNSVFASISGGATGPYDKKQFAAILESMGFKSGTDNKGTKKINLRENKGAHKFNVKS